MELESKAVQAASPEIKDAFDEFLRAFEAFKSANDERLVELETRSADPVTEEKVDRINRALDEQKRALDELTLAAARPAIAGERKATPAARETKAAFERYIRKGDAGGLDALELKAMSAGSLADGGYTVPLEIEQTIDRVLAKVSPMRAIATVRQIGGNVYRKPIATAGAATGWVAETDWGADWFTLSKVALSWCIIVYGFAASVLPVWLLLAPRDYLVTFLKIGVVILLAVGIVLVLPPIKMPWLTHPGTFTGGMRPVVAGSLFPFCFITIACGAISGFHSLVSSGTTGGQGIMSTATASWLSAWKLDPSYAANGNALTNVLKNQLFRRVSKK